MIQKIGKYRILERIGRGGMGSVYKAHDPILDRLVALKVVSAESDHTDELRARFFREAQACAKLSHPNVVTIHDLGEADGNLFIVMELLEGDELRQLIARRTVTHLEDKLPLMIQICEGLEYAHEKGIVHRDVKPGNIFVLRNGQVKILDFGIAQIAAAQTGLTRAGLIVGTLQYMAPERARGQGGHLSDIFSVGAVFYEFLTNRAPFSGDDPIEILEKLRTENPPRLAEVEPSLPAELGIIVERALAKDPTQRFANLGQMRAELMTLRRKRSEDTERLRQNVQGRLRQLHELKATLETRLGGPWADETVFVVDDRAPHTTLESVGRDTTSRIARLTELLSRADALKPALDSGLAALEAGDFDRAVLELDRVVAEVPEHALAAESLREAQHHVAERRQRREQIEAFVREASAAYDAGEYTRCLELLAWVAEHAALDTEPAEAARLRTAAQAALTREREEEAARREERRRASESAGRARERAERARQVAEWSEARLDQAQLWSQAETKLAEGRAAIAGEAYATAETRLDEARQLYERAEAGAREARAIAREAQAAAARRADMPGETVKPGRSVDDTVFNSVLDHRHGADAAGRISPAGQDAGPHAGAGHREDVTVHGGAVERRAARTHERDVGHAARDPTTADLAVTALRGARAGGGRTRRVRDLLRLVDGQLGQARDQRAGRAGGPGGHRAAARRAGAAARVRGGHPGTREQGGRDDLRRRRHVACAGGAVRR